MATRNQQGAATRFRGGVLIVSQIAAVALPIALQVQAEPRLPHSGRIPPFMVVPSRNGWGVVQPRGDVE